MGYAALRDKPEKEVVLLGRRLSLGACVQRSDSTSLDEVLCKPSMLARVLR
jgi:hypothetical protein